MWYIPGFISQDMLLLDLALAASTTLSELDFGIVLDLVEDEWKEKDFRGAWALVWALAENPLVPLVMLENLYQGTRWAKQWQQMAQCHTAVDTTEWRMPPREETLDRVVARLDEHTSGMNKATQENIRMVFWNTCRQQGKLLWVPGWEEVPCP